MLKFLVFVFYCFVLVYDVLGTVLIGMLSSFEISCKGLRFFIGLEALRSSLEIPTKFFNKFSKLKLNDLFKMEVAKIVHSHFTNNLPSILSKFFTLTKNISSRATRATES